MENFRFHEKVQSPHTNVCLVIRAHASTHTVRARERTKNEILTVFILCFFIIRIVTRHKHLLSTVLCPSLKFCCTQCVLPPTLHCSPLHPGYTMVGEGRNISTHVMYRIYQRQVDIQVYIQDICRLSQVVMYRLHVSLLPSTCCCTSQVKGHVRQTFVG